jgi:hypothetical protein
MLDETAAALARRGVALRIARDVGQVRDVLRRGGADTTLIHLHASVRDAVAAAQPVVRDRRAAIGSGEGEHG